MDQTPAVQTDSEAVAAALQASGAYRVLRRYERQDAYHQPDGSTLKVGVVVDTETTGLERDASIIELGIVRFEFCPVDGRVFRVLDTGQWFEDPGRPLTEEVRSVTGLADEMLAGRRIDDDAVAAMVADASLVIAHNAAFDRPLMERRLPIFADLWWGCSHAEIDWKAEGIGSTKLDYLAYRLGFFFDAHRAVSDCLALLHALTRTLPVSGRLVLAALLERVRQPTWRIFAFTPFDQKDAIKSRGGYAWSDGSGGRPKAWFKDVTEGQRDAEHEFLRGLDRCDYREIRLTGASRHSERAFRLS